MGNVIPTVEAVAAAVKAFDANLVSVVNKDQADAVIETLAIAITNAAAMANEAHEHSARLIERDACARVIEGMADKFKGDVYEPMLRKAVANIRLRT